MSAYLSDPVFIMGFGMMAVLAVMFILSIPRIIEVLHRGGDSYEIIRSAVAMFMITCLFCADVWALRTTGHCPF